MVPRPMPGAPLVVRRRYLIVAPRPLPAAQLAVRRRYLAVVPRPLPRCASQVIDRGGDGGTQKKTKRMRGACGVCAKSSQVSTLPKAKSQAKDKRAKDRRKYAALRCKVGVAPPGFEVRRSMSRVAFRVFPAGRAGDTRAAICAISCFVSRFSVFCVCM